MSNSLISLSDRQKRKTYAYFVIENINICVLSLSMYMEYTYSVSIWRIKTNIAPVSEQTLAIDMSL